MKIRVNNQIVECKEYATLQDVSSQLQLPEKGVAVAVNNQMIPRSQWSTHMMNESDSLVIIKAACGG